MRFMPALLLLAVAAVWATSLGAGFVFDDFADVVENTAAQAATFFERLPATLRPLLKATYALQDWLHGPWAPGFHAGNVALHVGCCAAVYLFVRRLVRSTQTSSALVMPGLDPGIQHRRARGAKHGTRIAGSNPAMTSEGRVVGENGAALTALVATALWAMHPALTASVTQVAGRSAVLSGLLVIAALLLATGRPTRWQMAAAGLPAFLAPLARETALVLPLVLLWWQLTLGGGALLRRALPVWIGTLAAAAIILAMPTHREMIDFSLDARGPLDALRGNVVAIPLMLRFLVMPWDVSIDPAQPRPWGWTDWPVLLSLAGLGAAALVTLLFRRRWPLVAFAAGWTLLCLLPSNSVLWRSDPVALRPLYLAGIGPALLVALLLARHRLGLLLGAVLVLALAVLTVERNRLYADPVALWRDAIDEAPRKARPWIQTGLALLDRDDWSGAGAALCEGLRLQPGNRAARQGLQALAAEAGAAAVPCNLP